MAESQNIEWKESWRDEYLKWICGFANAQGGKIYIGTNDDGTVIGIQDSKKLMEDIPNKVRDILGIIVDVNLLAEDEKEYIEICVSPNTYPVNYRGEYHYRSGSTKQLLKGQALNQFLLKKTGITWDSVPIQDVAVRDLRNDSFDIFREQAVFNAIAHKFYGTLIPIQIRVYADKIMIANDCVFPDDWTVDDLMGSHRSRPYNPLIANTFFRAGFIEAWGRGIEKIKDSCAQAGNPMPEYMVKKEDIMVTFKSLMTDTTQDTTQAVTQGTTQVGFQNIENSIPMRIIKVIKDNPALSQSQIAEMLGEKHDTIKYHMRKMRLSGVIEREGSSQKGKWIIK